MERLTGSEFPNEYIVVGGHLDSWDLGDGSHDDGAGYRSVYGSFTSFEKDELNQKEPLE